MPTPRFDPTISLGHILTTLSLLLALFAAYSNLLRTTDNHQIRLEAIEKKGDRDVVIQQQILNTLSQIQQDMAVIKSRDAPPHRP